MLISVLCPVLAIITLPNGFQFDETKYLEPNSRASTDLEQCERPFGGCSNDCSAKLHCNEWGEVTDRLECPSSIPYCVKNSTTRVGCISGFPMEGACLTKAINKIVCAFDGFYPDLTDCTKFHVCNGSEHRIETCPANHQFTYYPETFEDPMSNPGNGEFKCRFGNGRLGSGTCASCESFFCDGMANQFIFRFDDYFHYAYCVELGPIMKAIMFKCPQGTRHYGTINTETRAVDCVPIESIL